MGREAEPVHPRAFAGVQELSRRRDWRVSAHVSGNAYWQMLRHQVAPRHVAHNESAWPVPPLIMSGLGDSHRNGYVPAAP